MQTFTNAINTKYTMVSQNFTPISLVTQTFTDVIDTKYTWRKGLTYDGILICLSVSRKGTDENKSRVT